MSLEIDVAFVTNFDDNLRHLAQQRGSRLRGTVINKVITGDSHNFERIGAVAAVRRTSRHSASPNIDTPHSRRKVTLEDYHWSDLIDSVDEVKMLIRPTSNYAIAATNALARTQDDVIITAATGNANSIDRTGAATLVPLPAGQIVDKSFGTGSDTNLTLEKIIEARRILLRNEVDERDMMHFIFNSSAQSNLLNDQIVTSVDYAAVKALVEGRIDTYVGFKFTRSERLLGVADGTNADPVKNLAYSENAIGMAIAKDLTIKIGEETSSCFSMRVYAEESIAATRIEDEMVVEIQAVQAA